MARKTLGKMEFESLVSSLKEQNKGQLEAQRETTKSIRNLTAYFLKSDRADARRRLEEEIEAKKDAVKVSGKSGKGLFDKKIPSKGILGKFMDFFLTGALGSAGKGIFTGLWNSVKFSGGFYKGLAGLMGGLLLAPGIWESIKKNIEKEETFTGKMDVIFTEFLKKNDFLSTVAGGALAGVAFGGPKAAIAGALVAGGLSLVAKSLDDDESLGDIFTGDVSPLVTGGLGLVGGALAGAKFGSSFGIKGLVLGALIGGALGGVAGALGSADMQDAIGRNPLKFMMLSAGGAVLGSMAGFKAGAAIGMVGGPLGMLFGGLVGLLLGSLATYFLDKHFQSKVERRGKIKSLDNQILEMQKALEEEGKTGQGPKYRAKEEKLHELALRRKIVASLQAGEIEKGDVNADLEGIVLKDEQQLARKILKEESDAIQVEFSKSDTAVAQRENVKKTAEASIEASGSQDLAFYLREYLQRKLDNNEQINANENTNWRNWVPTEMQSRIEEVGPNMHPLTTPNLFDTGGQIVKMFRDQQRLKKIKLRPEDKQARGFGAYSPGSMQSVLVGDQPTAQGQELVFTEKKFNQIIGDIIDNNRLKQERDSMMAMIPAIASQGGGGGTSMPVINNSYSYQNTENTVREMPTTSSLNMMTALA